ncbi:MAG TPA: GNAT family N-acetyltransferase, partial [Aggregatilineales bacterium]|nr:GNAT family N-acetyltransferase [Aggregatilineales bacterium]
GVEIRRAGPAERDALLSLADLIWQQHVKGPTWAVKLPEQVVDTHQGWAELADDKTAAVWIAFEHGQPVAAQGYYWAEVADDNLLTPEKCVHFTVAATREEARGRGIGRALAREVFSHAIANGQHYANTDWRSTNLLASRVWPHLGFHPAFNRLVRRIDPRIAWAKGQ